MATVTGFTAARMLEIENSTVVDGEIDGNGDLILKTRDETEINAGHTVGAQGPAGVAPIGSVLMTATPTAPSGWLLCDGSAIDRSEYSSLFAAIGETYGAGDGETTFNLPNLQGRVPVGIDPSQTEFDELGGVGGEKTHTLTVPEMPSHNHGGSTGSGGSHDHGGSTGSGGSHDHGGSTGNAGAHDHGGTTGYSTVQAGSNTTGSSTNPDSSMAVYRAPNSATRTLIDSSHRHSISAESSHSHSISTSGTSHSHSISSTGTSHSHSVAAQGGGEAHNILQPFVVLNFIIRAIP